MAHRREEIALQAVHFEEGKVGLCQLVDLAIEVAVDGAQLLLHGDQVVKHAIERVRKLFKLVARLDLAADIQPPGGNGVGNVAQMLDRLHDHVTHDRIRRKHRDDRRDQGRRDQHGAVLVDGIRGVFHGQRDHHRAGQVADLGKHPLLAVGRGMRKVVIEVCAFARVAFHQARRLVEEDFLDVLEFLSPVGAVDRALLPHRQQLVARLGCFVRRIVRLRSPNEPRDLARSQSSAGCFSGSFLL